MSTQIAVRLPDELVRALDSIVREGPDTSRASVIERALKREIRRQRYEQEAEVLLQSLQSAPDGDLDSLATWAGNHFAMDE